MAYEPDNIPSGVRAAALLAHDDFRANGVVRDVEVYGAREARVLRPGGEQSFEGVVVHITDAPCSHVAGRREFAFLIHNSTECACLALPFAVVRRC